jgi:hypothetical protein
MMRDHNPPIGVEQELDGIQQEIDTERTRAGC